jgi:hypothetical protein
MKLIRYLLVLAVLSGLGAAGCDQRRRGEGQAAPGESTATKPLEQSCERMSGDALARCEQNIKAIREITQIKSLNSQ